MRIIVGYFFVDRLQSEQANFVSTTILPEVRETHFLAIMAHCGYIFTLLWLQRGEAHEVVVHKRGPGTFAWTFGL